MKWKGRQGSGNVEDKRGGGGSKLGSKKVSIGSLLLLLVVLFFSKDKLGTLMEMGSQVLQDAPAQNEEYVGSAQEEELAQFVSVVLKDTEDVWGELFPEQLGMSYRQPTLVLFTGSVSSACGQASSATGPFYCPGDEKLYIDLSFYQDLSNKFGASGDFAMAYVVAHEVAHHVQNLLDITDQVHAMRNQISQTEYNQLSVKLELQADFLAGVWAHHIQKTKNVLDVGDIEEALNAAHAIGDDRLQEQATGHVVPDSFTHGTSEQRMRWFKKGYETGLISEGNTFDAAYL